MGALHVACAQQHAAGSWNQPSQRPRRKAVRHPYPSVSVPGKAPAFFGVKETARAAAGMQPAVVRGRPTQAFIQGRLLRGNQHAQTSKEVKPSSARQCGYIDRDQWSTANVGIGFFDHRMQYRVFTARPDRARCHLVFQVMQLRNTRSISLIAVSTATASTTDRRRERSVSFFGQNRSGVPTPGSS